MSKTIIQEQVTLDQAIRRCTNTYRNGCNFRVRVEEDGTYIGYGCYLLYLLAGPLDSELIWWIGDPTQKDKNWRKIDDELDPKTIEYLKKLKPCKHCEGHKLNVGCDAPKQI